MFFSKYHRSQLKLENSDLTFGDLGKTVGAMWKAATAQERQPFEVLAAADKVSSPRLGGSPFTSPHTLLSLAQVRYLKQASAYKKVATNSKEEDESKPKEEDEVEEDEDEEPIEDPLAAGHASDADEPEPEGVEDEALVDVKPSEAAH